MENVKYFNIFRNGRRLSNFTHFDLLVGDIVEIVPGDSLSFDGVLVRGSTFLDIDESMITGVSNCIKKRPFNESS
jgi:Ca2+-transporting ATPase